MRVQIIWPAGAAASTHFAESRKNNREKYFLTKIHHGRSQHRFKFNCLFDFPYTTEQGDLCKVQDYTAILMTRSNADSAPNSKSPAKRLTSRGRRALA
jgi:hypothetical protein